MTTQAALYVRASLDKTGEGESVTRQIEACGALAASRSYSVVDTHADNDRSAKGHVLRPGFEALLKGIAQGRYGVVVATELTRLTRNKRDELRLMEAARDAGVSIALVRGQDIDLASASGRLVAEILASVARQEIDTMSERLSSGLRQRAVKGHPHWSARPYGYTLTGALVAPEAALLRRAYSDLLEGASLAQIGRDLGMPRGTVLKVMKAARNAGLRTYKGEIVGKGEWPAIVDEAAWRAACAVLADPVRDRGGRTPKWLLTGIAVGPEGHTVRTVVSHGRTAYSAPGVSRGAAQADAAVSRLATVVLAMPEARGVLTERETPDLTAARQERAELVRRRDVDLPEGLAAGISVAQVAAATRTINTRVAEIDALLLDTQRAEVFAGLWDEGHLYDDYPTARFDALPLHRRRAILPMLFTRISVVPGRGPEAVHVTPTALALRIVETTTRTDTAHLAELQDAVTALHAIASAQHKALQDCTG